MTTDPTPLTPPADAPLPWRVDDAPLGAHGLVDVDRPAPLFILDADDVQLAIIVCEPECRYLVAAANALPALLADHARLVAEVARLRGLVAAITNLITNPASIEHGLVMGRLARNLRDAAGCALAWRLHRDFELSWRAGDCEAWCPNLDGERAPGWER